MCFIGLSRFNGGHELYEPDSLVSPFFLPIRGEYNDYGSVEKVDRTAIVEVLEAHAGCDIDTILNGIERCLYGDTLKENIEYWKEARDRAKDSGSSFYDDELAQYTAIVPLFTRLRKEVLLEKLNNYLEQNGEDTVSFPIHDVMPVLLMEHEDIYDKFTKEFAATSPVWTAYWGTAADRFNNFMNAVNTVREHYDEVKSEHYPVIPSPTGHYTNFILYDAFSAEEATKLAEQLEMLFGRTNSLEFFDKLTDEERLKIYDECIEELKKFYCLYNKFCLMPMYFTFSQTAGMQNYRYDIIKELYDVCSERLNEDIKKEEEEAEEYEE